MEQPKINNIKIEVSSGAVGSKVWVDGVEQKYLTDIRLRHKAGRPAELELVRMLSHAVASVEGEAEVTNIVVCPDCKRIQNEPLKGLSIEDYRKINNEG